MIKAGLFGIFTLVSLVAIGFLGLTVVGDWFLVEDAIPDGLDVVLTFGGESARDRYTGTLVKKFPDVTWIISHYHKKTKAWLHEDGFDTTKIIHVDTCSSTASELAFVYQYLETNKLPRTARVGLVSGPYHMRRIFLDVLRRSRDQYDFYFLPVPFKVYGHTRTTYTAWWRDRRLRGLLIFEVKKMVYSLLKYWCKI